MTPVPMDARPASVAVRQAGDVLMLRWSDGRLGGSAAADADLLRMLNDLDRMAEELAEIEAAKGRPADRGVGGTGAEARPPAAARASWGVRLLRARLGTWMRSAEPTDRGGV